MTTRVYAKRKCQHCGREIAVVTFPQHMAAKHPEWVHDTLPPTSSGVVHGEVDGAIPEVKRES